MIQNITYDAAFQPRHFHTSESFTTGARVRPCLSPHLLQSFLKPFILHPYAFSASLFANPVVRGILISTGNIPVDRKSKDRQALFRGTFDALSQGAAVALFPEGTSYTEPRIMQVKDGAAWSALEYAKWAKENPDKVTEDPLVIVPTAIVYTNKSKYRSYVSARHVLW